GLPGPVVRPPTVPPPAAAPGALPRLRRRPGPGPGRGPPRRTEGRPGMTALLVMVLTAAAGCAVGWLAGAAERARLGAALARARRVAGTAPLTGLANRAALAADLAARTARGEPYALLLADLDQFKPVNDRHGHAAGDAVLVAVARRLAGLAPAGGCVARL